MSITKIAENLELGTDNRIRCSRCGREFCDLSENWKEHAIRRKNESTEVGLLTLHEDLAVFEYVCPNCGILLDVEIARKDEPPLWDMQLRSSSS